MQATVTSQTRKGNNPPAGEISGTRKLRYRPDIQGLRAVAVMLVVADHLKIPGFKG